MTQKEKPIREPLFHIIKRDEVTWKYAIGARAIAIAAAFVVSGLLTIFLTGDNPFSVISSLFVGAFGRGRIWPTVYETAILLCVSLAVTPAFRMRFWNTGAEGQTLIGGLATAVVMFLFHDRVPVAILVIMMFSAAILFGALWGVIPAVFKAKWRTNETLFTLMMNYVAIQVILYAIKIWAPSGSGTLSPSPYANLPQIGGDNFWLSIIVAFVMTAFMFIYLKFTKHGYEIEVVGESENTARYIGINVKKVIIRTLILSGLICGVVGFLLVAGINHTVSSTTAGGRGFTAILVSWLAKFNPLYMILTSLLVVFLAKGTDEVMTMSGVTNSFFSQVVTGIVFLMIIGCEFFINYKIVFRHRATAETPPPALEEAEKSVDEELPASEAPQATAKEE